MEDLFGNVFLLQIGAAVSELLCSVLRSCAIAEEREVTNLVPYLKHEEMMHGVT